MRKVRLDARYTPLANVPKPTNNIASERKTVTQGPPPRRRVAADASRSLSLANVGMHPAAQSLPAQQNLHQEDGERPADEGATFDGLRAAGAFGTATLIVFVTATVGVWGVKTHLGIETVRILCSISSPLVHFSGRVGGSYTSKVHLSIPSPLLCFFLARSMRAIQMGLWSTCDVYKH